MAYYRSYRRSTRRRTGRRALSSYSIATRTGAKSQSKQIYYLNKKINRIQRLTKPEIVISEHQAAAITPPLAVVNWKYGTSGAQSYLSPSLGSALNDINTGSASVSSNNFARLNSFTLYGNWQYSVVSNTSVPEAMRIVIVQTRTTRSTSLNTSDIFSGDGTATPNPFIQVYGPLQKGLARTCKVLSDKRYQLNWQHPSVTIKTKLRYLLNFYRDSNSTASGSSQSVPKGSIFVFTAFYVPNEKGVQSNVQLYSKLAYTDA